MIAIRFRPIGKRSIGYLLTIIVAASPLSLFAEDGGMTAPAGKMSAKGAKSSEEIQWQKDLTETRQAHRESDRTGAITSVAGLGLLLVGSVRAWSAQDVHGCDRQGSEIVCDSVSGRNEANDRIQQGRVIGIAGLMAGLLGIGYFVVGSNKEKEVERLERVGRRKGYKLSLVPTNANEMQIVLSRSF